MVTTLRAQEITLEEVERLLGFTPLYDGQFSDFLPLQTLSAVEMAQLEKIRSNFRTYIRRGKVSEGQARQIAINPILDLAGYNQAPIELRIEEDIQRIYIEDKDTHIRGRFDLVAVNRKHETTPDQLLWVLIVESNNLAASEFAGIAQMLTYAHTSLEYQTAVWGLVTNGATYQFFHIAKGEALTYQYMPSLSLLEIDRSTYLIEVLNAIRLWQP
jgi:Type I restriction enzyme R protein N terminus (HSDR_N)